MYENIWIGTQAEFELLEKLEESKIYFIVEEE